MRESGVVRSGYRAIHGAPGWTDQARIADVIEAADVATQDGSCASSRSDTADNGGLHVLRAWIVAGASLSVATAAGIQVFQVLGNVALALIASIAAFLTLFVGLVIALRGV